MNSQVRTLATNELKTLIKNENPNELIIDSRPPDAYNGWRMNGEKRGGHIPGAASFPFKWTNYKFELPELFEEKQMSPDRDVIIYGYENEQTLAFAEMLIKYGFTSVSVYHGFKDEWSANPDLPLKKLAKYNQLVPPQWVHDLINNKKPEHYEGENYVICHAHYGNREYYDEGHIPGAIALDTLELEAPETWNRRSPEELKKALEKHGITKDTTVLLYGRFAYPDNDDKFPGQSAGHLGSIRCAMIMMYAGVKDVKVMNGGLLSWESAGFETSQTESLPKAVEDFGGSIPANPQIIVDVPQAKEMIASDDAELVCVRSWPEYIGKVSGYNYIEKTGRIPGAVFGNCGSDAYHMENYRNLDHTIREFYEVKKIWKEVGIVPEKHIAFYCGTGWRGSEAFFNAYLMGWPRVSVFDGGWFEWSNDPNNPVETGEPVASMQSGTPL